MISLSHLKILINNVPKETHGLVLSDICPDDRQNYGSLEKMMSARVINSLQESVIGSEGTMMFLRICEEVTSSLTKVDLQPLERIYKLWYATFFIRSWRKWMKETKFKLKENFITLNAYKCIEINAANLILIIKRFRDEGMEQLFIPTLFNSQANEEIFRILRSMGTMNFTRINFTLLELFHLIGRVELQNNIVYIKLAGKNISFPRNKINDAELNRSKLPTDKEISDTMDRARNAAINDASKFGIHTEPSQIESCDISNDFHSSSEVSDSEDNNFEAAQFNNDEDNVNKSSFIDITLENGTRKTIRKSTYLWTLTDPRKHLSNDRLKRVQEADNNNSKKGKCVNRRLVFRKQISPTQSEQILTLCRNEELLIGDWCIFHMEKNGTDTFIIGNVLSFKYIEGRNANQKKYSWEFAKVTPDEGVDNKRGIEVLACWFEIGLNTTFSMIDSLSNFYINIEHYIATLNCQNIILENNCLKFTNDVAVLQQFQTQLSRIYEMNKK